MTPKYNQLIKKMLSGETLNALERAELENFDADALIQERDSISLERDQLKTEHAELKRGQLLQDIAKKFNCSDPEFLDFTAAKNDLDLNDAEAVAALMDNMQKNSPHCFYSTVRSGGGELENLPQHTSVPDLPGHDRIGRIAASIARAPEQY